MSDDFLRLVSQSNPAARQYQPANGGYPPSSTPYVDQSPQLLDPFFDDDDENMPDSAFGRPAPMQSQESGLPLSRSAAPPAGSGPSKVSLPATGATQGWTFDEDDFRPQNNPPFVGSAQFPGTQSTPSEKQSAPSRKRRWRWPWQKEKVLAGERVIALNNKHANADFASNFVSTSKYNLASFVPKFLTGTCYSLVVRFTKLQSLLWQNNSLNTPTYSFYSLRASSKYPTSHLLIDIPPLPR
jgi:hypothetical protein